MGAVAFLGSSTALWAWLSWYSWRAEPGSWPLVALGGCWLAWLVLFRSSWAPSMGMILVPALLLRLLAFFSVPLYEDDWARYLWDGQSLLLTGSPYDDPPVASFGHEPYEDQFGAHFNVMNYPDLPTIYGPVAQAVFAVAAWLAPGQLWVLKLLIGTAELATLLLLARLLTRRQLLLYAWCPLVIHEIWFNLHIDAVALAWAVVGLVLVRDQRIHARVGAGIVCGLSLATRLQAAPLLLLLCIYRRDWLLGFMSLLVALLCYLPYFIQGSWAGLDVTGFFLASWHYNAPVFYGLAAISGGELARLGLYAVGWLLALYVVFRTWQASPCASTAPVAMAEREPWPRADLLYGVLLVSGPVLNPWYMLWMLPFVLRFREPWCLALLLTAVLGYVNYGNLFGEGELAFSQPTVVLGCQFAVLLVGAIWSAQRWRQGRQAFT